MSGLKRGQVAVADLVTLRTAKDVRTLDLCAHCGHMGMRPRMIRGVLINGYAERKYAIGDYLHGRCVVRIGGVELLKLLPKDATFCLSIGDIGVDAMKALISSAPALGPRKASKKITRKKK